MTLSRIPLRCNMMRKSSIPCLERSQAGLPLADSPHFGWLSHVLGNGPKQCAHDPKGGGCLSCPNGT
jgi:hypothetical protein